MNGLSYEDEGYNEESQTYLYIYEGTGFASIFSLENRGITTPSEIKESVRFKNSVYKIKFIECLYADGNCSPFDSDISGTFVVPNHITALKGDCVLHHWNANAGGVYGELNFT